MPKLKFFRYFTLFSVLLFSLSGCQKMEKDTIAKNVMHIPIIKSPHDKDKDGIDDWSDFVLSARSQIGIVTEYDSQYYPGGFPPPNKGACADIIWSSLKNIGYDFKTLIDQDIQNSPQDYKKNPAPDKNINFRRVENIRVFLEKYTTKLTTKIIPQDEENLKKWQPGDIVTYAQIPGGLWHIAIISDQRRPDGIPLLLHNYGRGVKEDDYILRWPTPITGHYRWDGEFLKRI